jgi:hypothetical protein
MKFLPSDYIVTKDGQRGFVLYELTNAKGYYKVHLTEGYQVYSKKDLQIDELMYKEILEVDDISKNKAGLFSTNLLLF